MTEAKIQIKDQAGLHLRPAQRFCNKAMEYEGTSIMIRFRNREFNAKSVLGVLSACVQQMDEIVLVCKGPQEETALAELSRILEEEAGCASGAHKV